MATSSAELLDLVTAAITALLSGGVQSYRVGDREVTYGDLDELRQLRKELQAEVSANAGSAIGSIPATPWSQT